jgi:3-dehydroquinate synthase
MKTKKRKTMNKQEILISTSLDETLAKAIAAVPHDRLFVLVDEHTRQYCAPHVTSLPALSDAVEICIQPDDTHKTVESLCHVWQELSNRGASRHSLLINLGGGMVTDLGGFAASTFKRGIPYINIPTTLLSMVDAAVGGKTGINFNGLKNEVGVFCPARSVVVDALFTRTLDRQNLLSGYAEMLKHGLISNEQHWNELVSFDFEHADLKQLQALVAESIQVKQRVVEEDPYEKGIRKALNLGHTVGHAFESYAMETGRPVLHGYAVAYGLVCELYYSHLRCGFPADRMRQAIHFIKENYEVMTITCDDYPRLYDLMTHDKKNENGIINFTLLGGIGDIHINQQATRNEIYEMLDFYRETMN